MNEPQNDSTVLPSAETGASAAPDAPCCQNCGAELAGAFCHQCGQSVHDPIRHVGHAIEEVFESLWHLDGRVFRTLRDLLVPARVALGYLQGHRARYIAPLRLFVVLSLLTFFVGQMTVDLSDAVQIDGQGASFADAQTVAEVAQTRDEKLADLARARSEAGLMPMVEQQLRKAQAQVHAEAAARMAELQEGTPEVMAPPAAEPGSGRPRVLILDDQPWDAQDNPIRVRWLPASVNDLLNQKVGRAVANAPRLRDDEDLRRQVILGSVPTALFILMPVFALLLKLAYLGSGRLYLEHLVVALYSHAFLLLALLGVFLLMGLERAAGLSPTGAGRLFGWLEGALWWAMPLYLLIMQKRIYNQGWGVAVLKYGALGTSYAILIVLAAFMVGVAGLARL